MTISVGIQKFLGKALACRFSHSKSKVRNTAEGLLKPTLRASASGSMTALHHFDVAHYACNDVPCPETTGAR
jgi:hypothetical protein